MDELSERIVKRFETPILIAALLVIPVIVLEQSSVGDGGAHSGRPGRFPARGPQALALST